MGVSKQLITIRSRDDALALLGDKPQEWLTKATYLQRREDGSLVVQYGKLDLITYLPDGSVRLNTNRKTKTSTMVVRIHRFSPFRIKTERGTWNVQVPRIANQPMRRRVRYGSNDVGWCYQDGITLTPDNQVLGGGSLEDLQKLRKLGGQLTYYTNNYIYQFLLGRIRPDVPRMDYQMCVFCDTQVDNTGRTLGEAAKNGVHMLGHVHSNSQIPSIIGRAVAFAPKEHRSRLVSIVERAFSYRPLNGNRWNYTPVVRISDEDRQLLTQVLSQYITRCIGVAG